MVLILLCIELLSYHFCLCLLQFFAVSQNIRESHSNERYRHPTQTLILKTIDVSKNVVQFADFFE